MHDRNDCTRTDPRAGHIVRAGAADDDDRGPYHGTGGRGGSDRHRLSSFPHRGKRRHTDITSILPKGARIVATGVAGDRLVVTLDVGGVTEIRTFDAHTFKPLGKLKFANEP